MMWWMPLSCLGMPQPALPFTPSGKCHSCVHACLPQRSGERSACSLDWCSSSLLHFGKRRGDIFVILTGSDVTAQCYQQCLVNVTWVPSRTAQAFKTRNPWGQSIQCLVCLGVFPLWSVALLILAVVLGNFIWGHRGSQVLSAWDGWISRCRCYWAISV